MTIMIVFPERVAVGESSQHLTCGDEDVYLRSEVSGLKMLAVDTLVLMPGCSEEQRGYAKEKLRTSLNPKVLEYVGDFADKGRSLKFEAGDRVLYRSAGKREYGVVTQGATTDTDRMLVRFGDNRSANVVFAHQLLKLDLEQLQIDAARWDFVRMYLAQSQSRHMDGTSEWYFRRPRGKSIRAVTIDEMIDRAIDQYEEERVELLRSVREGK